MVDAGGEDAIEVVERLVAETCAGIQVPRVKTQRGETGRTLLFSRLCKPLQGGVKGPGNSKYAPPKPTTAVGGARMHPRTKSARALMVFTIGR